MFNAPHDGTTWTLMSPDGEFIWLALYDAADPNSPEISTTGEIEALITKYGPDDFPKLAICDAP